MKKRSKHTTQGKMFSLGEHIRVVPLHQPTTRRGRTDGGGGLVVGPRARTPAKAKLTYRGGALIPNVEVFTIFWGNLWGSASNSTDLMSKLNQFFSDIVVSPLIDQLSEYSVPGQTIGHGSFVGTKVVTINAPVGSVTDSVIQTQLQNWIASKTVVVSTANTLYFIYLDPGVISIMGGGRSCQSYCGYHSNLGNVYYAIMPYPGCTGCLGGLQTFDALTGTSSHELCEAITDPVPGGGWYDDANGEIGDICAWRFKKIGTYTVQLEWLNQQQKCA